MKYHWVYKQRWQVLALSLISIIIIAVGAKNIVQTADYKVYFDEDDAKLLASDELGDDYTQSDNLLFVIAPKDGEVFSPQTLSTVQALTEFSWKIPFSTRVDSITNYQHSYSAGDDLVIEDLITEPKSMSETQLAEVKTIALHEPNLKNRLISADASVTAVNVTIKFTPGMIDSQTRDVVTYARELVENIRESNADLDVYLTGIVMMNNAFPEASEKDGATLIPIMLILILIGLYFLLRSGTAVVTSLLVMLLAIAAAMGMAGWWGYKINPVSGAAPIIILTVAIADCVHILMAFMNNFRNLGMKKHVAMDAALASNTKPVLLTTLSTAIGFLSMNFSDAPPFRELGNITAVGIVAACFLSLTLLPALINILPVKLGKQQNNQNPLLIRFMDFLAHKVWAAPGKILLIGFAGAIGLSAAAFKNELNEDFIRYFDDSFDVRISTEFALDRLTGISVIEYDILASGEGQISQPEYMNNLDKFTDWLKQQPEVMHVNTFSDTVKRLNKNLNYDDPSEYQIPNDRNLIAQYVLLYETSLPFGLGITDRVKLDKSATRLTVTLKDITNQQLLDFEQRAHNWMQSNLPDYMHSDGLGWSMMFGDIAQKNIASMLSATLIAVLLICAILVVPFKSIKIGMLSIIPNLLPAMVALGIWGLTVGMIGLAASIITALTFGIVVDDSIHFINRYIHNRRHLRMPLKQAVQDTFLSVGKAIVVTSIILVIGFSVLAASGFKVNSIIGYLSATTIMVALLMDLFIFPALLIKLDSWLFNDVADKTIVV